MFVIDVLVISKSKFYHNCVANMSSKQKRKKKKKKEGNENSM